MSYPTSQGSLHVGTCPCNGCNPPPADAPERDREAPVLVELLCLCGQEWTSEAVDGELGQPECEKCGAEGIRA